MATKVSYGKFVDSLIADVIEPGIEEMLAGPFFTALRDGKLTKRQLQGTSIQHYWHNVAIIKGFALSMVRNASNDPLFYRFGESLASEEWTHPAMCKKFGLYLGLGEEDFANAVLIYEEEAFVGTIIRQMYMGENPVLGMISALVNEGLLQRAAAELDTYLKEAPYNIPEDPREFFTVHAWVDIEHSGRAAEALGKAIKDERDETLVTNRARDLIRFQQAKWTGYFTAYGNQP
ncbi:MAG: iron-containing redox enzyme family protein [Dehalococcoidia bacterium]